MSTFNPATMNPAAIVLEEISNKSNTEGILILIIIILVILLLIK